MDLTGMVLGIALLGMVLLVSILLVRAIRDLRQVRQLRQELEQMHQQIRDVNARGEAYLSEHAPAEKLPFDRGTPVATTTGLSIDGYGRRRPPPKTLPSLSIPAGTRGRVVEVIGPVQECRVC